MGSLEDSREPIYLDYNATTPLDPTVLDVITETLRNSWANPSSKYPQGVKARDSVDAARKLVADMVGAVPQEILFTSGGTEANHLVFHSVLTDWKKKEGTTGPFHVISCPIEHDAVILPLKNLEEKGEIELTLLTIDPKTGAVRPDDVRTALRPNTRLISLMLANNETGAIQPIPVIAEIVSQRNANLRPGEERLLFHTDAAQAIGKIDVNVDDLDVDYLTIVGHKFYGPRIGALYVRRSRGTSERMTPIFPMFFGGGQEGGLRPGTENTGMIAGLGQASLLVSRCLSEHAAVMRKVRDALESHLSAAVGKDAVRFNHRFPAGDSLPNTCSVSFLGVDRPGEHEERRASRQNETRFLFAGRELLGLCPGLSASVGAACHSDRDRPSPILLHSGVSAAAARCTLRLTVGRVTTEEEVAAAAAEIAKAVKVLRSNGDA